MPEENEECSFVADQLFFSGMKLPQICLQPVKLSIVVPVHEKKTIIRNNTITEAKAARNVSKYSFKIPGNSARQFESEPFLAANFSNFPLNHLL